MTQRAIDGDYIYFVTANVQNRQWFFVTPEKTAQLGQTIQTCCRLKRFKLLAYCILPNHIHLLVRKLSAGEDLGGATTAQRTLESARCRRGERLIETKLSEARFLFPHRRLSSRRCGPDTRDTLSDLMRSIKGTFSRTLPKGKFWQHRSNFRIIETEEYLSNVLNYIIHNYQKMALPAHYGQPPFVYVDQHAVDRLFA